jgi:hypothetical protein
MNISSLTTFRTRPSVSFPTDQVALSSVSQTTLPDPVDEFVPTQPQELSAGRSASESVTFSELSGRLSSEFAEFSEKMPEYFSKLGERNPSHSFVVRRSQEDKLSLRVRHNGKPHFLVDFDSSGKAVNFYSPDEELQARQRLSLPKALPALFDQIGLTRPSETFPAMAQAYSPEAVMEENRRRLAEPAPDLAVCRSVAGASTMFQQLDKLEAEVSSEQVKTVESARLKLQQRLADLAGDNTKGNLLALQEASDYITTMTREPDNEYKKSLQSDSYGEKLKKKLFSEGTVLYSHGQPFWRLRSTLQSGELSSPALRGLVPGTDCSFVNICVNRHNTGGIETFGESLSYALGSGSLHPAGPLFLVKPSPLDNFPGQPATRNVVFRPGDEDGRLFKILVADKTLPQVKAWLSEAGLDPELATGYKEYVSDLAEKDKPGELES